MAAKHNDHSANHPNMGGVVGNGVKAQDAGRYMDSPVPHNTPIPDKNIVSKAGEVASADHHIGDAPHPNGVLGRA